MEKIKSQKTLADHSFVVFDVETTGLYPYSGDRICEIGAVKAEPSSRRLEKFHCLVNPERPISKGAFYVNRITGDMVMGKPTIDRVLPNFMQFIEGSVLVAYNAGFDLGFLECSLGDKKDVLEEYYIIDALRLARQLFPGIDGYSLGNVAQELGIKVTGAHRALADAVMTWKIFKKELRLLKAGGIKRIEDIELNQPRKKHLGATVKDYRLELIRKAIEEQKKLNILYRSLWHNTVTKRTITPKKILPGYDRSYVIAHCHLRNEERNFRVDCMVKVEKCE